MDMAYATVTVAGTQQPVMKVGTIEEELKVFKIDTVDKRDDLVGAVHHR